MPKNPKAAERRTNTTYPRQAKDPDRATRAETRAKTRGGRGRPRQLWPRTRRHPPNRNATQPKPTTTPTHTTTTATAPRPPPAATPTVVSFFYYESWHTYIGRGQSHRALPPATARPHTPPTPIERRPGQKGKTTDPTRTNIAQPDPTHLETPATASKTPLS